MTNLDDLPDDYYVKQSAFTKALYRDIYSMDCSMLYRVEVCIYPIIGVSTTACGTPYNSYKRESASKCIVCRCSWIYPTPFSLNYLYSDAVGAKEHRIYFSTLHLHLYRSTLSNVVATLHLYTYYKYGSRRHNSRLLYVFICSGDNDNKIEHS